MDDDDDSSNSSDNDDMKSVTSEPNKPESPMPISFSMDIHSDTNNNHTGISLHTNGIHKLQDEFTNGNLIEGTKSQIEEFCEEDEERKRFQIELEFVQSL